MDSVAEILPIVADSISTHSFYLSFSLSLPALAVASLHLAQYKILLCCFFIKRIDLIPKLARHLHLPAHRLACVCVCSLTKDTYVFECILRILSCIRQCAGLCARVWVFATILAPFCLVRFKCWNFNAAHITFPFLCLRTYGMHSTECRISLAVRLRYMWGGGVYLPVNTWECNHLYLICRWWQCDNQNDSRSPDTSSGRHSRPCAALWQSDYYYHR